MSTLGPVLGSAGAAFCAMRLFMITAFGGGAGVAPGRPPLARGAERTLDPSRLAGPPLLAAAPFVAILVLARRTAP